MPVRTRHVGSRKVRVDGRSFCCRQLAESYAAWVSSKVVEGAEAYDLPKYSVDVDVSSELALRISHGLIAHHGLCGARMDTAETASVTPNHIKIAILACPG